MSPVPLSFLFFLHQCVLRTASNIFKDSNRQVVIKIKMYLAGTLQNPTSCSIGSSTSVIWKFKYLDYLLISIYKLV